MQQPGKPTLNEFPPLLPPLSDSSPLQRDDTPPSEPPTSAPAPDYDNTRTAAQVASDAESLAASNLQLRTRVHDLEAQLVRLRLLLARHRQLTTVPSERGLAHYRIA